MKLYKHLVWWLSVHLCFLCCTTIIQAADFWENPKYGKISDEEWKMTQYEKDPAANAVILFDIGSVYFDSEGEVVFERHKRLKVFNRNAFDVVADVSFLMYQRERLVFDAATFSRNANGEVTKNEVENKQIFDTNLPNGRKERKFTYPALSEGCILDLKYVRYTDIVSLRNWYFQDDDLPTIHNEYRLQIPDTWDYTTFYRGQHSLTSQTKEPKSIVFLVGSYNYTFQGTQYKWVMQDSPKFEAEKYVSSEIDYIDQITGKLTSYIPLGGSDREDVIKDWASVKKMYMESDQFGKKLELTNYFKKLLESNPQLTKGTPLQNAKAIYAFVKKEMEWNDYYSDFSDDAKLSTIYEKHTGNSADINFVLYNLLQAAGIKVTPLVTSTRENGSIERRYPSWQQFNHFLLLATIGESDFFLDATHDAVPFGMLHTNTLNRYCLIMDKQPKDFWVNTQINAIYQDSEKMALTIDQEGNLQGSMRLTQQGYSAYQKRLIVRQAEPKKFIESYYTQLIPDIVIDSFHLKNLENDTLPLVTVLHFKIPQYAQVSGNNIYFNPSIFTRSKDNPFVATERYSAIDFGAPIESQTVATIKIPEGYRLEGFNPDNTIISTDSTAYFQRKIIVSPSNIQILDKAKIGLSEYPVTKYADLRRLFEAIYTDNTLVFKK